MEPVQSGQVNQSYYDPSQEVCSSENQAASSPESQSRATPPNSQPAPSGTSKLLDSYTNQGAGGAASSDATGAHGASASASSSEPPEDDASVCEGRLAANDLICDIGVNLLAERYGMRGLGGAILGHMLSGACKDLGEWVEKEYGACKKDGDQ